MTTKKASSRSLRAKKVVAELPAVYHGIAALLNAVRCIGQKEDQLCTLLHAAKDSGDQETELQEELAELLDSMPSYEYVDDLEALRLLLDLTRARPAKAEAGKGKRAGVKAKPGPKQKPKQKAKRKR